MTALERLHDVNAWVLIGANALVGLWCLLAYRFEQLRGSVMWVAVVIAQITTFVQAIGGALLANQEGVELDDMHALYGFTAIIAVGIMYSYRTSPFMKGKETLLYGVGCLFVMGLGLRNLYL